MTENTKDEERVLFLIRNRKKILPGEIQVVYEEEFEWISFKEIVSILESLKKKGYVKGDSRMGYRNIWRFSCKCKSCGKTFDYHIEGYTLCPRCEQSRTAEIERELYFPHLEANIYLAEKKVEESRRKTHSVVKLKSNK